MHVLEALTYRKKYEASGSFIYANPDKLLLNPGNPSDSICTDEMLDGSPSRTLFLYLYLIRNLSCTREKTYVLVACVPS